MKSLFISKNWDDLSQDLINFCQQNNLKITAHSFLSFKPIDFKFPEVEVVFFSSPRAVEFGQKCIETHHKIACTGEQTAKSIEKLGRKSDYVVSQTKNIEKASQDFAKWTKGRTVFFPCSNISKLSFAKNLNENQYANAIVYETIIESKQIAPKDFLVFTSPSNVVGFLKENVIVSEKIIAWGESTSNELEKNGISNYVILNEPNQKELIAILSELK